MDKKKVLLVYTNVRLRNQKPRPPLGLMYLAAALRPKYEPVLLDLRVESIDRIKFKQLLNESIYVGISTIIGQQLNFSLEIARLIKRLNPHIPVVFGGTFPTMAPEIVLKEECIDIISLGDGEDTHMELADVLSSGGDIQSVHNIAYRKNGKVYIQNECRQRSLDTPVMPAWDLVNINNYREVNVLTSKGCSTGCDFCYNKIFNHHRIRLRNSDNVWKEISYLHLKHHINHIAFVDDNFFEDREHARLIMEKFRDSGWNLTWETTCRADDLSSFSNDYLQLIHDAGCRELFVGFESASDRVLKSVHKKITNSQMVECMERARKYGFLVRALFVIGLPGENKNELMQTLKTVDFLRREYSDCVKIPVFGIYTPYPQLPPNPEAVDGKYREPKTMQEWSFYHHDKANHQWLSAAQRDYLENIIWTYRYYAKRSKYLHKTGSVDRLLYYDAYLRWKLRLFSWAPEWKAVRNHEQAMYKEALQESHQEYEAIKS